MKKSVLLFAIIASVFVACDQSRVESVDIDYENQDVYGVWAKTYGTNDDSLFIFINNKNTKFISKDSLRIYHGHWNYTEVSDLGYIEYKYKVVKNEKLFLTAYDPFNEEYVTHEYQWRPDLLYLEDEVLASSTTRLNVKGLLGKWEWFSTRNLDSCSAELKKHIVDTLENSIIEFKLNTSITLIEKVSSKMPTLTMEPYTVIITKKDVGIIEDDVLPIFDEQKRRQFTFFFPIYRDGEYTGYMNEFGGVPYTYSLADSLADNNNLSLFYANTKLWLRFKKIE